MESEIQVLLNIGKEKATQRLIAEKTGMSLGSVNEAIKRLVKTGFLEIEKISTRSTKYNLTPKGLIEKYKVLHKHIVDSFRYTTSINEKIEAFINSNLNGEESKIVLFGEQDEILSLLKSKLIGNKILFEHIDSIDNLIEILDSNSNNATGTDSKFIIIVWQHQYVELLEIENIRPLNLLNEL
ncbi:MAG: winged helix-turn-helix transcriptional regulator [Clostridia bacterium]|nr:winged helix-turn-helix transcriptional regulator [Clostridia bacterium]